MKVARLTQEDPPNSIVSPAKTSSASAPSPFVVFPWLAAQLVMGFVGYKQYERALIDYVDLFVEGFYQLMAALAALGGGTLSREDYDKDFGDEMREGLYASPLGVFFNRARWAGFSAAGLGLVGTAVA